MNDPTPIQDLERISATLLALFSEVTMMKARLMLDHSADVAPVAMPTLARENPLLTIRHAMGMTRAAFALHLGLTERDIQKVEQGRVSKLTCRWILPLQNAGISYKELADAYRIWRETMTRESLRAAANSDIAHITAKAMQA